VLSAETGTTQFTIDSFNSKQLHCILLRAHIDNFVLKCTNRQVLDAFRKRLLDTFDGTYEGPLEHYLGCEIASDLVAGTTQLSKTHYAEEVWRSFFAF